MLGRSFRICDVILIQNSWPFFLFRASVTRLGWQRPMEGEIKCTNLAALDPKYFL